VREKQRRDVEEWGRVEGERGGRERHRGEERGVRGKVAAGLMAAQIVEPLCLVDALDQCFKGGDAKGAKGGRGKGGKGGKKGEVSPPLWKEWERVTVEREVLPPAVERASLLSSAHTTAAVILDGSFIIII
jgi:hypothetical protein